MILTGNSPNYSDRNPSQCHFVRDKFNLFLISNFRPVLNAVCFLLGNSPASEFYIPTFRNTVPSS
jgi:hypothetical protein